MIAGVAALTATADTLVVELLARDVDAVVLDLEHGAIDDGAAATAVLVAHAAGARAVARCATSEPARASRFLDAGGDGIIAARIDDAAAAAAWVAAMSLPPRGRRGIGASRATAHGRGGVEPPEPWLCMQIETAAGLADTEAIAATPGVAALLVGERDLSHSLGVPGRLDDPRVTAAHEVVAAAARRAGRAFVAVAGRTAVPADLSIVALTTILERGIRDRH